MANATPQMFPEFSPQILPSRAVVRMAGEGVLPFLHNLLTTELLGTKPAYGALLTPQGKILHDVFVVPVGDVVWIDAAKSQVADFLKRMMMYRLRAKIEMDVDRSKEIAVSLHPQPGSYADPRLAEMGYRAVVDVGRFSEGEGYDDRRIALGLADSDADIGSGELFVHEANLDHLNGVSFSKGCYVGQEVVSRTHHRNAARNRILPVTFSGAATARADIQSGEQRLGTMLSSRGNHGLALLRLDRLADVELPLLTAGVRLSVQKPLWARFDVTIPEVAL